jgi:hypothetical protein
LEPAGILPVQQVVHVDHGHTGAYCRRRLGWGGARRVGGRRRGRIAH